MELSAGMVIADRFRLERELGRGGMGAVWLAQHLGLDVPCAIKFILAQAAESPELRGRFEREAKAAAHIRSPNVVQILDYGIWQETPYIAMELLEGEDLGRRLSRVGRLDARETAVVIGQVARALGKAHAQGIVHRDIKPSNVFLCGEGEEQIAKVVDFGIAKSHTLTTDGGQTRPGSVIGTPTYMSPEQLQGKVVDHRTDLWALGVMTFQCLTGKLPFDGKGFGDLAMKILAEPLPVPSSIAPVPPGFDGWWQHAASRDPAQRFQSARELAEGLYLALGISSGVGATLELRDVTPISLSVPAVTGSTPTPGPTPAGAGASAATRRKQGIAITAGVGILLVVAMVGGVIFLVRPSGPPGGEAASGPGASGPGASAMVPQATGSSPTGGPAATVTEPAPAPTAGAGSSSTMSVSEGPDAGADAATDAGPKKGFVKPVTRKRSDYVND